TGVGGLGETWTGLGIDPNTGILYGTTTDLTSDTPSSTLYAIDTGSGRATLIGSFGPGRVVDIALAEDPSGRTRGSVGPAFWIDTLSDVLEGFGSTVGPLGFNAEYAALIDFNGSNGTLYLAAIDSESPTFQPDRMYTVNTTTGAATLVGDISADP